MINIPEKELKDNTFYSFYNSSGFLGYYFFNGNKKVLRVGDKQFCFSPVDKKEKIYYLEEL